MTITSKTYFKALRQVPVKQWPPLLREAHDLIVAHTDNGKDWSALKWDKGFKSLCDATFEKWEDFFQKQKPSTLEGASQPQTKVTYKEVKHINLFLNYNQKVILKNTLDIFITQLQKDIQSRDIGKNSAAAVAISEMQVYAVRFYNSMKLSKYFEIPDPLYKKLIRVIEDYDNQNQDGYAQLLNNKLKAIPLQGVNAKKKADAPSQVDITPKEIKYVRQYLGFNKSVLLKSELEKFIDALQKDIKDQHISKHSKAAPAISAMQDHAVNEYNKMRLSLVFEIPQPLLNKLNKVLDESITDTYTDRTRKVPLNGLEATAGQENLAQEIKHVTESTESSSPAKVMNSVDFLNLSFKRLGFKAPWLHFIGDPSPGFTMMVFGRPKYGKSYLCLDFAGYLARNHGRVLYVAKEEKLDRTLQDKIIDKSVAHPDLVVADAIPEDLSGYEFIFLDSINKLGLTPQDLERLKLQNKGKSFVYIFQVNKSGAFKGSNTFQHDVDVVVELPEIGKAIQYGRFNQGGELNVFPENKPPVQENNTLQQEIKAAEPALYGTLEGINKKTDSVNPEKKNPVKAADTDTDYSDTFALLKRIHEENIGKLISDEAFNALFKTAIAQNKNFLKLAEDLQTHYMGYVRLMDRLSS